MINKHLDGLEMFLGVFETCSNSSNLEMPRGWHIYIAHQVHRAVCSRWAFSAQSTGYTGEVAPVQPITHSFCTIRWPSDS